MGANEQIFSTGTFTKGQPHSAMDGYDLSAKSGQPGQAWRLGLSGHPGLTKLTKIDHITKKN